MGGWKSETGRGKIATQPPPPPSDLAEDVDPELEAICLKMMAKHPDERYASMRCVDQALSEYLSDHAC